MTGTTHMNRPKRSLPLDSTYVHMLVMEDSGVISSSIITFKEFVELTLCRGDCIAVMETNQVKTSLTLAVSLAGQPCPGHVRVYLSMKYYG